MDAPLKRTPLYAAHLKARARMVPFSGWEMPLLLRALAAGRDEKEILTRWEVVRNELTAAGRPHGDALVAMLQETLDHVRREWIAADRMGWLQKHEPYCGSDEVRRLVSPIGPSS